MGLAVRRTDAGASAQPTESAAAGVTTGPATLWIYDRKCRVTALLAAAAGSTYVHANVLHSICCMLFSAQSQNPSLSLACPHTCVYI